MQSSIKSHQEAMVEKLTSQVVGQLWARWLLAQVPLCEIKTCKKMPRGQNEPEATERRRILIHYGRNRTVRNVLSYYSQWNSKMHPSAKKQEFQTMFGWDQIVLKTMQIFCSKLPGVKLDRGEVYLGLVSQVRRCITFLLLLQLNR